MGLIESTLELLRRICRTMSLDLNYQHRFLLFNIAVPPHQNYVQLISSLPALFEVIPASNGQEAIEKMAKMLEEEVSPDVTLMDLRMPVMDGLESSKQLSAMGVNNIHILTAYVDSDLAKVAVTVGVKGIMDKKEGFKAIAGRVAEMVRDMRKADSD